MIFPVRIWTDDEGVKISKNLMGAQLSKTYRHMTDNEKELYRQSPEMNIGIQFENTPAGLEAALEIPGYISLFDLARLSKLTEGHEVGIEIGSLYGRSTRVLSENIQTVFAVDTFNGEDDGSYGIIYNGIITDLCIRKIFESYAREFPHPVGIVQARSDVAIRWFLDNGFEGKVDFIFIDGDHSYEGVKSDIENYMPLLVSGGIMCGHDYQYAPVKKAVDDVVGEGVVPIVSYLEDGLTSILRSFKCLHKMWAYQKE